MLILISSVKFNKRFREYNKKIKKRVLARLNIFVSDEYNRALNNHQLHGEYIGCRSINVAGDIRIIYSQIESRKRLLIEIGTHNQLYE